VVRRNDRDAKVEFFFADGDLDPSVLGSSSFGDIDPGEDFDPREDRTQESAWRAIAFD
jgi:hypothetical protein